MLRRRRRGVGIIDTKKGILVVAMENKVFTFPGGGANRWESRKKATIREIKEETSLDVKSIKFLFKHKGVYYTDRRGRNTRNYTKVFLVETTGKLKIANEIKYSGYWKPGSKIPISPGTKIMIDKYLAMKKST